MKNEKYISLIKELSAEEEEMVKLLYSKADELQQIINKLESVSFTDKRAVDAANEHFQTGIKWAIRSIVNPIVL